MMSFSSRASRIFAISAAALNACVDPSEPTQPVPRRPQLAVGDVLLVTNTDGGAAVGSLRSALNQTTGGEIIRFDPSLAGATIALDTTLEVPKRVTIEGPADRGITISGGRKAVVLHVHEGATLRNLTIADGKGRDELVGGILSTGPLVLEHTTVSGNEAGFNAGIRGDVITLINSTVANNNSTGNDFRGGAGIGFDFAGALTLINSTVALNTGGAGIGPFGGRFTPTVTLNNSIIASNTFASCANGEIVTLVHEGKNIADDESCGTGALVMLIADPLLAGLADNGGPTRTLALTQNSPAINATDCDLTVDQRFVPRQGRCDIGAFEFEFTNIALTVDPRATVDPNTGSVIVRGTIGCSRVEAFDLAVTVNQNQRAKRTPTVVEARRTLRVNCETATQPWIALLAPPDGQAFENGTASLTAKTVNTATGVNPSTVSNALKLFFGRK